MKKIQVLLRATVVFLLAFFVSFNLVVDKAMATGQFSLTCKDITLDGSTLSANCKTRNGGQNNTSISLDEYIGNLDGTLSWGDHNFSQTCSDLGLAQSLISRQFVLAGNCERAVGRNIYSHSEIGLNDHIANIDGTLEFE